MINNICVLVAGVLSDPGFSSKENKKVVERAYELYDEVNAEAERRAEAEKAAKQPVKPVETGKANPAPAKVTPPPTTIVDKTANASAKSEK